MKQLIFSFIACFLFIACSSDLDEVLDMEIESEPTTVEFPIMPSDTVLWNDTLSQKYDEVKSRAWEVLSLPKVYLISDYKSGARKVLEIPVSGTGENRTIRFCLSVKSSRLYASCNNKSIPIKGDCILSSFSAKTVTNTVSKTIQTPNGKTVDEPFGDRLFRTEPFSFSYKGEKYGNNKHDKEKFIYFITYGGDKYNNEKGSFQTDAWLFPKTLAFLMDRYTSKIKANLIITDYTLGLISVLSLSKFQTMTGTSLGDWSFQPFITDVAHEYDLNNKRASGKKIVPLIQSPYKFEYGQNTWFTGGIYYEGMGKRFYDEEGYAYLLPKSYSSSKLCYSFYCRVGGKGKKYREFNTLEISIKDIHLDPNVENEITTIFHINDFVTAMKNPKKTKAGPVCYEDPDFGIVTNIPCKIQVNYN